MSVIPGTLLEHARQICIEYCERLRETILRSHEGIQQEDFAMLFLAEWNERFNATVCHLAPHLSQHELHALHRELSLIGGKYLMLERSEDVDGARG
ncbi:MAG: hypothetical protein MUF10_05430 [Thermoanaerobaculaceae bacterium]|jgi:hypothetical protein|nr:hypothetical protein [Thermoanaerobaculaceae bacterium]